MKKKNATKNATIKNRKNGEKEKVQDDTTVTKIPFNSPHNREIVKISVNTENNKSNKRPSNCSLLSHKKVCPGRRLVKTAQ